MLAEYTCVAKDDAYPELTLSVKISDFGAKVDWCLYVHQTNVYEGSHEIKLNDQFMSGVMGYGPTESGYFLADVRKSKCAASYFSTEMIMHLYKLALELRKEVIAIKKVKELK